jgi:hypothetical protein
LSTSLPVSYQFQTVGYLSLENVLPEADTSDVNPTSAVVAAFNYPVVPLGGDPAGLPAGFSIEPAAAGHGEWINTSTYIYYPEPALELGFLHAECGPLVRSSYHAHEQTQAHDQALGAGRCALLGHDHDHAGLNPPEELEPAGEDDVIVYVLPCPVTTNNGVRII